MDCINDVDSADNTVISVKILLGDLEGCSEVEHEHEHEHKHEYQTSTLLSTSRHDSTSRPQQQQSRRSSWLTKLKSNSTFEFKSKNKPEKKGHHIILMTRTDYLRYWARDPNGNYTGTEPEGSGRRILRHKHRLQAQQLNTHRCDPIDATDAKEACVEAQFNKVVKGPMTAPRGQDGGYAALHGDKIGRYACTEAVPMVRLGAVGKGEGNAGTAEYWEMRDPMMGGLRMKGNGADGARNGSSIRAD